MAEFSETNGEEILILTFLLFYLPWQSKPFPWDLKVIMSDFRGWVFKPNGLNTLVAKWVCKNSDFIILFPCFQWVCDPPQRVPGSQPQPDTWHTRVSDAGGRGHTRHEPGRDEHHQGRQWSLARQVSRAREQHEHDIGFYCEVDAAARMCRQWRPITRPAPRGFSTRWVKKIPE